MGLCMLIACSSLVTSGHQNERRAVHWIQGLVGNSLLSASFGEMLLLMAIHFHSNQLNAISELVCQTLGMKIVIRSNNIAKIKTIFTQEIFTDQVVTSHAVKVPVTGGLSSENQGFLPVHCIHQLLKSRAFAKNKVPIKDWIYKQITSSSAPLHPVMPALIEVYINSILIPTVTRGVVDQTNEPISEAEIREVFQKPVFETTAGSTASREVTPSRSRTGTPMRSRTSSPKRPSDGDSKRYSLASQILMLYYILQYEQVRLTHMRSILSSQRKVLRYSKEILADLPMKFLLQASERDRARFGVIFPQLLKLCSTQYPHLCLVQDWLEEESKDPYQIVEGSRNKARVTVPEVKEALTTLNTCPSKFTMVARRLLETGSKSPGELWKFSEVIVQSLKTILEPGVPRQVRDLYKRLWFELNRVFPRKLWAMTVNASCHNDLSTRVLVRQEDLVLDPLQILRCDRRVLRNGSVLEILLYILKACLAASKTHLSQHVLENPIMERGVNSGQNVSNDSEREELKNALVATQESAAIQILLEAALAMEGDDEAETLSDLREIRSLICSYLHESFITDINLGQTCTLPGKIYKHAQIGFEINLCHDLLGIPSGATTDYCQWGTLNAHMFGFHS